MSTRKPNPAASVLPAWADAMVPVDMDGAALLLGVSRRFLVDILRDHPHFERRGVKKVFYPEHIARLRDALVKPMHPENLKSSSVTSNPDLLDTAFEQAMALATGRKRL